MPSMCPVLTQRLPGLDTRILFSVDLQPVLTVEAFQKPMSAAEVFVAGVTIM
jgi:hypothetical protein